MQTFLPYRDFAASARTLDAKRLGKQRVEVVQIVRALTVPGYAWKQHPAVLMWQGYEEAIGRYGLAICDAWVGLGFADTCAASVTADLATFGIAAIRSEADLAAAGALPPWLDDEDVLQSHQSALVRKDPEFCRRYFPDVRADIDYVWPVRAAAVIEREERQRAAARRRQERAEQKIVDDLARAKRRRSAAATLAARTRAANAKARAKEGPSTGSGNGAVP